MIDEGHEPPIDIRGHFNVTTQSSPAGAEVSPGKYMVNSLQATAGFRYAQWMDRLFDRHGVRAVLNKGGMSQEMYQTVFKKHGVVCLSTMPYGIGAIYGKAVTGVRDVYWKEHLGIRAPSLDYPPAKPSLWDRPGKPGQSDEWPQPRIWKYYVSERGNDNGGHEYGTQLSEPDKNDLIEYLKTL